MRKIKTREVVRDIKVLDKAVNLSKRMKDTLISVKGNAEETQSSTHNSPSDYADDKVQSITKDTAQKTAQKTNQVVQDTSRKVQNVWREVKDRRHEKRNLQNKPGNNKKVRNSKVERPSTKPKKPNSNRINQISNTSKKISNATKSLDKSAKTIKSAQKGAKQTAKGTIKTSKKTVKTAGKSIKQTVKTAHKTSKVAQKTAQTAMRAARAAAKAEKVSAKATIQAVKLAIKATAAMVKAVIAAIKGLVAAIAAGGWVAVLVILVICLIALLISSIFGIFFSSEENPDTGQTINSVIAEINLEYTDRIDEIKNSTDYDLVDMSGARASWKQVLSVYTVKTVSDPDNPMEVATVNDEKAALLNTAFWDMNTISHEIDSTTVYADVLDDNMLPTGETTEVTKTVLRIIVSYKTAMEYGFNEEQNQWLAELLKPEYNGLWNGLLYGITSVGDGSMLEIAETQLGNIGGELYWRWCGFDSRVAWCACFVSWCAEQCGYIEAGIIPSFALCDNGITWFKDNGQWQDSEYTPAPGDIIFFDWDGDGSSDHVGIVENVEGDYVNAIEGNTDDSCARRNYSMDSASIMGYGVPCY